LGKGLAETLTEVLKPQTPLWGCEVTSRHIVLAGVSPGRNAIRGKVASALPADALTISYTPPNIHDVELIRSTVKRLMSEAWFTGSEIVVVVPDDAVRIAFVSAENPSKNPEEQQSFIRWKLKKSVPFDVDSAQIAYRILGKQNGHPGVDILVAMSPRPIVEEYENLFDSLDIHAGMIVPSTLALINLLNATAEDTLVLKTASDCITTTIFKDGRMQFYRRVAGTPSLYDAAYPTVMYYQDKLGGTGLRNLYVCGYDSAVNASTSELEEKLKLVPRKIGPAGLDDIFKPVLGSVHLAWQNLI